MCGWGVGESTVVAAACILLCYVYISIVLSIGMSTSLFVAVVMVVINRWGGLTNAAHECWSWRLLNASTLFNTGVQRAEASMPNANVPNYVFL